MVEFLINELFPKNIFHMNKCMPTYFMEGEKKGTTVCLHAHPRSRRL